MSSLTCEWQLQTKDNCLKYIIDVENFDKKVQNYRVGREIYSKIFKIASSKFQIYIYPSGDSNENRNYVSVFLHNKSSWRVKATVKYSIQYSNISHTNVGQYFQDGDGWGPGEFIPHARCTRKDVLTKDGTLTLQADVELLEEEIPVYRDLTKTDTISKLECLEGIIKNQEKQIDNLEKKVDALQASNRNELVELKSSITRLTSSLRCSTAQSPKPIQVECPVCLDVVRKPMRLKQCGQGHIICDSCHERVVNEAKAQWETESHQRIGNPNLNLCHACRGVITGRPSMLERVLGLN